MAEQNQPQQQEFSIENLYKGIKNLIISGNYKEAYETMVSSRLKWPQVEEILLSIIDNPKDIDLSAISQFVIWINFPNAEGLLQLIDIAEENTEELIEMHKFEDIAQNIEKGEYQLALELLNEENVDPEFLASFIIDLIESTHISFLTNVGNFIIWMGISDKDSYFERIRLKYYNSLLEVLKNGELDNAIDLAQQYNMLSHSVYPELLDYLEQHKSDENSATINKFIDIVKSHFFN
ncbi:hypothetical protein ACFL21_03340 [Patescibacteria group bacterium]